MAGGPIEESPEEEKSRSQIKRELRELKELGKCLVELPKGRLAKIPLSDATRDAVISAQGMTRGALQRQYRFLVSLLESEDLDSIQGALAGKQPPAVVAKIRQWRERLLSTEASEFAAFLDRFPECDRSHLSRLIRTANKEVGTEGPQAATVRLTAYIKQWVVR